MGKASRRKRERVVREETVREETKAFVTRDPYSGTVTALTKADSSIEYEARIRSLPEKIPGHHRMIVTVAYSVTLDFLQRAQVGEPSLLDMENLITYSAGCWDCEHEASWCQANPVCPGDPQEWG